MLSCYRKNWSAVYLIFTSRITFRFEIAIKRLYVRLMLKLKVTKVGSLKLNLPKVTKMGSIIGHKIDYKEVGVLRGQR